MALTLPTAEPCVLGTPVVAGDTWTWELTPPTERSIADGWTLSYSIGGPSTLTWSSAWATNDGNTWTVVIPAASTLLLTTSSDGRAIYTVQRHWTGSSTYAGYRLTDALPALTVVTNAAGATGSELQSWHEAQIASLRTQIAARNAADMSEYSIPDQMVKREELAELRKQLAWHTSSLESLRVGGRLGRGVEFHSRAVR